MSVNIKNLQIKVTKATKTLYFMQLPTSSTDIN